MTDEKIGGGEKFHIYISGIVMLALILFAVGLFIYVTISLIWVLN